VGGCAKQQMRTRVVGGRVENIRKAEMAEAWTDSDSDDDETTTPEKFGGATAFVEAAGSWADRSTAAKMMIADKRLFELLQDEIDSRERCQSELAYLTPSRISPGNYANYVKEWAGTEEYQLSEDEQSAFDSWAVERAKDEDGEQDPPARPHWELLAAKIAAILLVREYNEVLGEGGCAALEEQLEELGDDDVIECIRETAAELASEQNWEDGGRTWNPIIHETLREKHFRFLPSQLRFVDSQDDLRIAVMIRGSRMEYKGETFESLFKYAHYKEEMQEIKDEEDAVAEADDEHVSATEHGGEGGEEDQMVGQKRKREPIPADAEVIEVC
jgi:hypothetical protein